MTLIAFKIPFDIVFDVITFTKVVICFYKGIFSNDFQEITLPNDVLKLSLPL